MKREIYLSLDIETDGPAAGINNMLTLGAAAFNREGESLSMFYARIFQLPYLQSNPTTMTWWLEQDHEAYREAFSDDTDLKSKKPALDSMLDFNLWVESLSREYRSNKIIALAWPAVIDFSFINYYTWRFLDKNPLGYSCIDIRSWICGICRSVGYFDLTENQVNKLFGAIDKNGYREHVAVDDAITQGRLFFYLRDHPLSSVDLIKVSVGDPEIAR